MEQIGAAEIRLDARAGVGAGADAEAEAIRRRLAHAQPHRRRYAAVGARFRLAVDVHAHRREIGRRLQRALQLRQLVFAVGLAGADAVVVARDKFRQVALEAVDLDGTEAVGRTSVVGDAEAGGAGLGIDLGAAVGQTGGRVFVAKQLRQQILLGPAPVGLAKRPADRPRRQAARPREIRFIDSTTAPTDRRTAIMLADGRSDYRSGCVDRQSRGLRCR